MNFYDAIIVHSTLKWYKGKKEYGQMLTVSQKENQQEAFEIYK